MACSLGSGVVAALLGDPAASWDRVSGVFVQALYGSGTLPSPVLGIPQFGAAWFLLALFLALCMYDRICGRPWATAAALGLFAVGMGTVGWWLPWSAQAAMCAVLFLHIGWMARNRWRFDVSRISLPVVAACALVWAFAYVVDKGELYLVRSHFAFAPLDVLGAVAGTVLVLALSNTLARVPVLSGCLQAYGRHSLLVLCVHMFDLRVVPWWMLNESAWFAGHERRALLALFVLKVLIGAAGVAIACLLERWRAGEHEGRGVARYRLPEYDVAKGIAIASVIVGHQSGCDPVVRAVIFSFHMPLFFLANACFVGSEYRPRRTLARSARTLVVPYAVACLLATGLKGVLTPEHTKAAVAQRLMAMLGGMSRSSLLFQGLDSVWLVWFVACLFVARNVYVLVRWLCCRVPVPVQLAVPLALSVAGWWLGGRGWWLPWSADVALFAQAFFLAGDEARRRGLLSAEPGACPTLAVVAAWLALALGGFQIEMANRSYPGPLGCVACACLGSLAVFLASRWLCGTDGRTADACARVLAWAGRQSMVILAVHCLRMMWSQWAGGYDFVAGYDWWLNAVVELAFCAAVALTWQRLRAVMARRTSGHADGDGPQGPPPAIRDSPLGLALLAKGDSPQWLPCTGKCVRGFAARTFCRGRSPATGDCPRW